MGRCGDEGKQLWPRSGTRRAEMNTPLARLASELGGRDATVYCYVIETVEYDGERFSQGGSGPNLEGGRITLCTCKHRMRSARDPASWGGQWIAGFTGKGAVGDGYRYLVYLMRVGNAYASQRELWDALSRAERIAKSASTNRLGDVFEPKAQPGDPYDPQDYYPPRPDHSHAPDAWRNDIEYVGFSGRRPALLVSDPDRSYIWDRPRLRFGGTLGRGYKRVPVADLLRCLDEDPVT